MRPKSKPDLDSHCVWLKGRELARSAAVVVAIAALVPACGGGRPVFATADASAPAISGWVVKGPVAFATVTAYRLDKSFNRGDALATTQADAQGQFSLSLPPYSGHLILVASTGVYTEEAVGRGVKLDGSELRAVVHDYRPGLTTGPVLITPVSHWASALASFWVSSGQAPLGHAIDEAYRHLGAHFGGVAWASVQPTDFNGVDGGVQTSGADLAGLTLAALSQEALGISNRAGVTPGVGVTSMDLVNALADDLSADGLFDGVGRGGPLHLPPDQPVLPPTAPASATALDGQTVRGSLAAAMTAYLQNPRDLSGLTFRDVQGILDGLSSDGDPRLFRDGGTGYDVTPPLLAFVPVPPLYTADAGYLLTVLAADPGSGVAGVYALTGASAPLVGAALGTELGDAGVMSDGGCIFGTVSALPDAGCVAASLYQFQLSFPAPGHYPYTVYAVDNAGNSTQSNASSLSFTVTFDDSPPNINLAAATVSYVDERQLQLQMSNGSPVVPPVYQFPGSAQKAAIAGSDVYKTSSRLSWGSVPPTAAALDGQQPATLNIPFLDYQVPYDAAVDSPIVSATYSLACTANCGANFGIASGSLIPDPSFSAAVRYLLPLSLETVPGLAQVTGSAHLDVTVTVNDAAGNSSQRASDSLYIHVIGPPLSWAEDASYPATRDAKSTYRYEVTFTNAADEYANAFNPANFSPDGNVRLVRYIVQNPHAVAAGLTLGVSPSSTAYQQVEVWNNTVQDFTACDGEPNSFCGFNTLSRQFTADPLAAGAILEFPQACIPYYRNGVNGGWQYQWRPACPKNGAIYYASYVPAGCSQPAAVPMTGISASAPTINASSPVGAAAFLPSVAAGGESAPAAELGGELVVPASTGSTPGSIVVYLVRPADVARVRPLIRGTDAMADTESPLPSATNTYNVTVEDFWLLHQTAPCYDSNGTPLGTVNVLLGRRHGQFLATAQTQLAGTVGFSSQTILDGALIGEGASWGSADFTRSIDQ